MPDKARLFIIGASSLARELETWIELIPDHDRDWELTGFLHDCKNGNPLDGFPSDYNVLGDWETFDYETGDRCLIGVSDVGWREKIYTTLKEKVWFMPFVAPSAIIGKFTKIPDGTVVCPNCTISTNVTLGVGSFINCGTQIGHDTTIGNFCSIMASVDLSGFVQLGNSILIGSNATVLPKRKIADSVTIGTGSIVLQHIKKEGATVFGNPAAPI